MAMPILTMMSRGGERGSGGDDMDQALVDEDKGSLLPCATKLPSGTGCCDFAAPILIF